VATRASVEPRCRLDNGVTKQAVAHLIHSFSSWLIHISFLSWLIHSSFLSIHSFLSWLSASASALLSSPEFGPGFGPGLDQGLSSVSHLVREAWPLVGWIAPDVRVTALLLRVLSMLELVVRH
jgi:hypothetical protein